MQSLIVSISIIYLLTMMNLKLPDKVLNILLADDDLDDRFFFEKVLQEIPISTYLLSFICFNQLLTNWHYN